MFLKEFNQSPMKKINKLNALLKEQFNVSFKKEFVSKQKLEKILENANNALVMLRTSNKKFQLEPDYAKFLGIRDIVKTMLEEGHYANSPTLEQMKREIEESIKRLMDSGYTMEEASSECMNRYRMDPRWAYDDEYVLPIVLKAAKTYYESSCGMSEDLTLLPETDLSERLLTQMAKEVGVELSDMTGYEAIEEKLNSFAEVSGKSRDAVVSFLNALDEEQILAGIQMFGRKIGEANAFVKARRDAIAKGEKKFTVGGKEYKVTGDTEDEKEDTNESMFDDILADLITEEVDVEQAEVVMAVRALADDIQDQIERLGRMMNEDVPAIADQMRGEMGASQAQGFADATTQLLNSYMEAAKSAKSGMDQQVGQLTGEGAVGGLGDTADLGGELGGDMDMGAGLGGDMDMGMDEPVADNMPATSGPEDEPLGRAEI